MGTAVGIDLGTTNTVVAAVRDGVASTLADPDGYRLLPSIVSFHPSGHVLVGRPAMERRLSDPASTVHSVKRLIGRAWDSEEVQRARARFPFEMREGPKGSIVAVAGGQEYSLPEISAFVLRQAKAIAEAALGAPVDRAVITVPANFNDLQRAATKVAGRLAGLEVLRILNEPTAAALAYGQGSAPEERIAVYDLGGGTFDITLLDLAGNVFEVLSTAGDTALGGDDVDVIIAEKMADELFKKHRFDARATPHAYGRLRIVAEQVKRELSTVTEVSIKLEDLVQVEGGRTVPFTFRMTRPELEWASLALIERTFNVCKQAIDTASIQPSDLDRIILVGGVTRMPMVARKVEQFFGRPPVVRINPDEVVALGAAIQAGALDPQRSKTARPLAHPRIDPKSVLTGIRGPDKGEPRNEAPELPVVSAQGAVPTGKVALAQRPALIPGVVVDPMRPHVGTLPFFPPTIEPSRAAPPEPGPPPGPREASTPVSVAPDAIELEPAAPSDPPAPPLPTAEAALPLASTLRIELPADPQPQPRNAAAALSATQPLDNRPRALPQAFATPAGAPAPPPRPAPLLIDVTPLRLSVETVGGYCDTLIDANTPVPCDRTRAFATAADGQTSVSVRVAQGESKRFGENTYLGEVVLYGLRPAARGETQIAVTFEIDADGILNVRARDVKTGNEQSARITLVGAQTDPQEIEAMRARQAAMPVAPLGPPRI
jgi:molecular chaperone DnaK